MKINFKCKCGKSKQTVVIHGEMILDKRAARFYDLMWQAWQAYVMSKFCFKELSPSGKSGWNDTDSDFFYSEWNHYWIKQRDRIAARLERLGY